MGDRIRPPIPYYGGKTKLAPWIAERLPMNSAYAEPFAGVGSVLLARPKAKIEMINDASQAVITWWRMLRDRPAELETLLQLTPWSRVERDNAREVCANTDEHSDIDIARAFHVLCAQSLANNLTSTTGWRTSLRDSQTHVQSDRNNIAYIPLIAERIRDVQLECIDGVKLLSRLQKYSDITIYADPPYPNSVTSNYLVDTVVHDKLIEALLAQRGHVAVSGYPRDFDMLYDDGWHVDVNERVRAAAANVAQTPRIECLWTNYKTPTSKRRKLT